MTELNGGGRRLMRFYVAEFSAHCNLNMRAASNVNATRQYLRSVIRDALKSILNFFDECQCHIW